MENQILERSSEKLDRENFSRLVKLVYSNKWLEMKSNALYDLWQLAETDEEKTLIEFLIRKFRYLDSRDMEIKGDEIASYILNTWHLKPESTLITATSMGSEPDGSQVILQCIKNKFPSNWTKDNFCNSLDIALEKLDDSKTLILADDFIGTGNAFKNKILPKVKEVAEIKCLRNLDLKIIAFVSMEFSQPTLKSFSIDYFVCEWLKKGISENMVEADAIKNLGIMTDLEKKLSDRLVKGNCHLGYKKSEALYAPEGFNIPNNVFPIFWFESEKMPEYKTFFKRR